MLKYRIKSLEEVEEKYRGLYVKQDDGTFTLDAEVPADDKKKVDEFRNKNIQLMKQVEDLQAKFEMYKDIDPDKAREALDALSKLGEQEEAELIKKGKFEDVLARRTGSLRSEYDKQIAALKEALDKKTKEFEKVNSRMSRMTIESVVAGAVAKAGTIRKGALDDVLNRAKAVFEVDAEGNIKSKGMFNEKAEPVTPDEWAKKLLQDAPFLFEPSSGSGATGGKNTDAGNNRINTTDPIVLGRNVADIASGKMKVTVPTA